MITYDASFSTMWANKKFPALDDFFIAARQMGFARVELNHQINSAMLTGIELDHYQFSSVHEPCPADISTEMLKERDWLVSSPDEECRRQGVASIKRSIDLAQALGAGIVVMHSGIIQVDGSLENNLRALFEAGQVHSQGYLEIKNRLADIRDARAGVCLESVKKSLMELLEYAGRFGVRLGLENRYHYFDIPSLDEMGFLLGLAGPDQLGFVYDTGHAQALDRLGFYPHEEWLKRYASRMIGAHLHDAIGITDHLAPGLGEVDFDMVATYLPEDAFRTCEFQVVNTTEQVKAGLKFLVEHGCIKCL
jgi:sugar phosphate isomerase/epimerase